MTAGEIARDVRSRRRSATEIVSAALAEIERRDPELNAFTARFAERALAAAARIDARLAVGDDPGVLAGVPFAAKNLFDVAGVVTRAGAVVTATDPPAERDAHAIAALEAHGAILVGVTNMDEFAYGFVTENAHDGTTRNPHDLTRIAGGSSGGSAAAVAGGLVPLALGSDTNGSIRVPAALCGIFGIRPTFGRLARAGAYPFCASIDTIGPFAATADDLVLAFDVLDGSAAARQTAFGMPRIARLDGYFDEGLLPEARAAVDRACELLGVRETAAFPEARRAREAAFIITAAEAGELHAERLRTEAAAYDPATRERLTAGALIPAAWYLRAQRFRTALVERVQELFSRYDLLIAPTTPHAATEAGRRTIEIDGAPSEIRPNLGVFTQPLGFAGLPIAAIPVWTSALPLGVQLIARPGRDELVLAAARHLEREGLTQRRQPA